MSEVYSSRSDSGTIPHKGRASDWLCLAATPTFAIMALLTGVLAGPINIICGGMQGPLPLNGMTLMYLLMSLFHSAPWLKLISGQWINASHS